MKLYIFDRVPSSQRLTIMEFKTQLKANNITFSDIDVDSREGAALAELYDVMDFPSIVVARDDGQVVMSWQHEVPTAADVSAHIRLN